MNDINAAQRLRVAAADKAEAEKIKVGHCRPPGTGCCHCAHSSQGGGLTALHTLCQQAVWLCARPQL